MRARIFGGVAVFALNATAVGCQKAQDLGDGEPSNSVGTGGAGTGVPGSSTSTMCPADGCGGDGGTGGIDGTGGAGGDGPGLCGGDVCDQAREWCMFPSGECGETTHCEAFNSTCVEFPGRRCACDGNIYESLCGVQFAGLRAVAPEQCELPGNSFVCDQVICEISGEYCDLNSIEACQPLPAACNGVPSCACTDHLDPACTCDDSNGYVVWQCGS